VRLTATKSSLGRHRNLCLARPQGSDSTSPRTMISASPDPRARTRPRLGRRSPPRPTPRLGLSLYSRRRSPPRRTPGLGLSLDLEGVTTSLEPTTPQGEAIITLPLASPVYGEQDRRPIWLAPVKQVMMAPCVLHDNGGSQPLRKQGYVSKDLTAPTAVLLQGSSAPPTTTTPHEHSSSTSPTATSART
jgi:hypothetical protein